MNVLHPLRERVIDPLLTLRVKTATARTYKTSCKMLSSSPAGNSTISINAVSIVALFGAIASGDPSTNMVIIPCSFDWVHAGTPQNGTFHRNRGFILMAVDPGYSSCAAPPTAKHTSKVTFIMTRVAILALVVLSLSVSDLLAQQSPMLRRMDRNRDGKITKDEFPERFRSRFDQIDANGDALVSDAEFASSRRNRNTTQERRSQPDRVAPTHADMSYGDHQKQAFDIWLADSKDGEPTPLVIYIHGGGFRGGDKGSARSQPISEYLKNGISFASMNYRLSDVGPYPIMMHDAARGLQFIRSKADQWNLDSEKIACYGGSAGAGISLWLGFHDDLADPDSDDPIARMSTRIIAAGTTGGQSTYDIRTFREWFGVPNLPPHPALEAFYDVQNVDDWQSKRVLELMEDASPINHLTSDDVPVFMTYSRGDVPVDETSDPGLAVHHARLGIKLKESMDELGLECHVTWPGQSSEQYWDLPEFLTKKLTAVKQVKLQPDETQAAVPERSAKRSVQRGRTSRSGEFYAPPAMGELVPSRLRVGDLAPKFSLKTTEGAVVSLDQFQDKLPVVLVFGSITCSPFRQKVVEVFDIQKRYADRAHFLMIYIREAHPESKILIPIDTGGSLLKTFAQTATSAARVDNARSCQNLLDVPFPVLVDAEDNETLADYGGWPNRLVVVDASGRIAWDSGQGPRGFQPQRLEAWLREHISLRR
jgi:acetyl esterase/lipase